LRGWAREGWMMNPVRNIHTLAITGAVSLMRCSWLNE